MSYPHRYSRLKYRPAIPPERHREILATRDQHPTTPGDIQVWYPTGVAFERARKLPLSTCQRRITHPLNRLPGVAPLGVNSTVNTGKGWPCMVRKQPALV